jgi:hypothetical protein
MSDLLRLKLDKEVNVKEFLSFLDFHQFQYTKEEEEILNIQTMVNEKSYIVLIDENKLEEFKVLVLVYKDLLANKTMRQINISIEKSLIDYEKTRKINTIELVSQNEQSGDEIFKKANGGDVISEKDMEDSFYGNRKRKKDSKKDSKKEEPLQIMLNKEEFLEDFQEDTKMFDNQQLENKYVGIKDILKIIGLLIFTGILVLIFMLIR